MQKSGLLRSRIFAEAVTAPRNPDSP
jgi:hypothetical protein